MASKFTQEFDLGVSAPRVWKALKDSSDIFPKIAPQVFASIENLDKNEDVGSVRIIKFGPVAPEGAFVKEKLTALDHTNFSVTSEEIEGGHLNQGFTKWAPTWKVTPVDDKSCKFSVTVDYEGSNDAVIAQSKEGFTKVFKGLANYIQTSGAYA